MATASTPRAFYGFYDRSVVLVFKGQLRYSVARPLRTLIDELLAKSPDEAVIIDLSEVEFIDSTGMGLLARLGRSTLKWGRRSVIICPPCDVLTCLNSAAFDTLFVMVDAWPFEQRIEMHEFSLEAKPLIPAIMGALMLDAHRDLVALSEENRGAFGGVVAALETELNLQGPTRYE